MLSADNWMLRNVELASRKLRQRAAGAFMRVARLPHGVGTLIVDRSSGLLLSRQKAFMLYFAYGSNMDFPQMRERCPSAQFVAVAELPEHRLAFTRYSGKRGCGVADAIPDRRTSVWGAVFSLLETDVGRLDRSEGFVPGRVTADNSYNRDERHVWRNGDEKDPLLVSIYFANRQTKPPLPNAAYKRLIVEGAKYWNLPAKYTSKLKRIAVTP